MTEQRMQFPNLKAKNNTRWVDTPLKLLNQIINK